MAAVIAPRVIQGDGTPEPAWLAWDGLARIPTLPLDQWLKPGQRLVVVAPHPDDEILAGGAMASMHSQRGGSVLIVAVTDGEASHRGSSQWSAGSLAAERRTESAEGLALLLAPEPQIVRFNLPDGGVSGEVDRLRDELAALLRPSDVVVTTWRLDGHPDHEATGNAAAEACAARCCTLIEAPVWMWHWAAPDDVRVPWRQLRGLAITPEAMTRRQLAIAAHATQLSPRDDGQGPVLPASLLDRLERNIEYFFVPTP